MTYTTRRAAVAATTLATALVLSGAAGAQDKAAAEALFDRGRAELEAKHFAAACQSFEDSQKLDPGIGTLLYLADCYEKSGKTASAWATFREAESTAKAAGQAERQSIAQRRAAALEARLPRIAVSSAPENDVPGLEIRRDGAVVARSVWGTPVPADPGTHTVSASAPGRVTFTTTATVEAGAATTRVTIPVLASAPVAPVASASAADAKSTTPRDPTPRPPTDHAGPPTSAWIAGGVGVTGLAVGAIFGLSALSKNADAKDECRPEAPSKCTARGVSLGDEAKGAANVSTIAFAIGGVALATGAVLWLSAPATTSTEGSVAGLHAAPLVGPDVAGAAFGGSF